MARLLITPSFLGALFCFSQTVGPVSPAACRAAGIICVILGWLATSNYARPEEGGRSADIPVRADRNVRAPAALRTRGSACRGRRVAGLVLLVISLALMLGGPEMLARLAGLALNLCALSLWVERNQSQAGAVQALCGASVFYFGLLFLIQYWPCAWWLANSLSCGLSTWAGRWFGTGVVQGASTGGLYVFALGLAYLVCRTFATWPRRWELLLLGTGFLMLFFLVELACGPVYAVWLTQKLARLLASNSQTGFVLEWEAARSAAHAAGLLFVAVCILLTVLERFWGSEGRGTGGEGQQYGVPSTLDTRRSRLDAQESGSNTGWKPALLVLVLCLLASCAGTGLLLAPQFDPAARARAGGRILFDRQAGETLRDFSIVPDFQRFGLISSGMFGQLPLYLSVWGYTPVMRGTNDPLDAKLLSGADVFVVINPERSFTPAEHEAIWRFVRAGGALLVLGDHTDMGGSMKPLNRLLAPAGIRFNFDSAFTPTRWINAYEIFPHVIARGLDLGDEKLRHSTGASLSLDAGVTPIISAKWGFSDAGDHQNVGRAYLGDYRYEFQERLGDVAVIAEAVCGQGKALVFGDTSAFQNVALAHSHSFVREVFRHLVFDRPRGQASAPWGGWIWVALLVFAGFAVRLAGAPAVGVAVLAPFLAFQVANLWPAPANTAVAEQGCRLACVDATHLNRFSLESWKDDSIDGLLNNLSRNGLLAEVLHEEDWEKLSRSKVLVVIAPCRPYLPAEIRQIHRFMQGGGWLLLSIGYEERVPAANLLASVGMDIGDMPLGPVPLEPPMQDAAALQRAMEQVHFKKAWPLRNTGASAGFASLYRAGDYDVVGLRRIGAGGAAVIADSLFLQDKVLESERAWWEGNIQFLRMLFEKLYPKGGGA